MKFHGIPYRRIPSNFSFAEFNVNFDGSSDMEIYKSVDTPLQALRQGFQWGVANKGIA
jgi:hypothetical protein